MALVTLTRAHSAADAATRVVSSKNMETNGKSQRTTRVWIIAMAVALPVSFIILAAQSMQYPRWEYCSIRENLIPGARLITQDNNFWPPGVTCKIERPLGDRLVHDEIVERGSMIPSLLPFPAAAAAAILVVLRRRALAPQCLRL